MTGATEDLRPAVLVSCAALAAVLVADAVLARSGKATVTRVLRTPLARAVWVYVGLHRDRLLGPLDLFDAFARRGAPHLRQPYPVVA